MSDPGEALRTVMRRVPQAVVVVTTGDTPSSLRGMTASSFVSVALSPPLISVNVEHGSQMHTALTQSPGFTVNLLTARQAHLASHFAIPGLSSVEQWASVPHRQTDTHAPIVEGVLGWLRCRHHVRFEAGDHTIFVGEVITCHVEDTGHPLLIWDSHFRSPSDPLES